MKKRFRSAGVRDPARRAIMHGVGIAVGIVLVVLGTAGMRDTGADSSPLVLWGMVPLMLCPIFCVYYVTRIRVFHDMRSGRTAIARWMVPAKQFHDFCAEEQRIAANSVMINFYRPPRDVPADGVEVIFSDRGVLIGGGWFPLSVTGGRALQGVRYNAAYPPTIEFELLLVTRARTSSTTIATRRELQSLRVPVAMEARGQVDAVLDRYQAAIEHQRARQA